jgi:hypothetical protein
MEGKSATLKRRYANSVSNIGQLRGSRSPTNALYVLGAGNTRPFMVVSNQSINDTVAHEIDEGHS